MKLWAHILLLSASCFADSVKRGYVITTPKRWVQNSNSQVCFHLKEPTSPADKVAVSITGYESGEKKTVVNKTIELGKLDASGISCVDVFMGKTEISSTYLQLEGSISGSKIREERRIAFSGPIKQTFIQTDKYMYKPGQQVKFRVLTLEGQYFKVSTEPYPAIYVETPSSSRIAQWLNVSNTQGLIHEELQLIEEPDKGTYQISVETSDGRPTVRKTFVVEDYVLPRFEVKTTAPSYVLASAPELKVKVCATYTFGQPVRGRLEGIVENGGWGQYNKSVTISEDIFGCKDLVVQLEEQLDINYHGHKSHSVKLKFKVTEDGTENYAEDDAIVSVERTALTIKTEKKSYLKPEVPFISVLKASFPDSQPATSEPFEVCVGSKSCKNFTSDSNGLIKFSIPPHLLRNQSHTINIKSVNHKEVSKKIPGDPSPEYDDHPGFGGFSRNTNTYMYGSGTSFNYQEYYSPSNSSLLILPLEETLIRCTPGSPVIVELPILYSANKTAEAALSVQLVARGQVQHSEVVQITFDGLNFPKNLNLLKPMEAPGKDIVRGATSIKVSLPPAMSPKVKVLIWYTRSDGEVVPDSQEFEMTKCLAHQVTMSWPQSKVKQGTTLPLELKAEPDSLCSLGIVDKSVELLAEGKDSLTKSKVFDMIDNVDPQEYDSDQISDNKYCSSKKDKEDPTDTSPGPPIEFKRKKRTSPSIVGPIFGYRYTTSYADAIKMFDEAGLLIFSDLEVETRPCEEYPDIPYLEQEFIAFSPGGGAQGSAFGGGESAEPSPKSTRSYFPETWIWELFTTPPEGQYSQDLTLPDTITEWVGKAVCVHPTKGIGLSSPTSITTFTPFFVDLTLLPTIRKGEILPVVISVFNYMETSLPVRVTLEASDKYEILENGTTVAAADQNTAGITFLCIPKNDKATATIKIRPVSVDDVYILVSAEVDASKDPTCSGSADLPQNYDRVEKSMNVEYEGFPREKTWTKYVCSDDLPESGIAAQWTLEAPANIVNESERSWITVVGDLLGPTLENLGHLIRMPTGCGEQNMITFSPNIYVLQYLEGANLLDPITEEKLLKFMNRGYQRELKYRHPDGSFSAWGPSDTSGSTWLTAFVVKSFAQSRPYITIDHDDLQISTDWLRNIQVKDTGCFANRGRVLHKEMLGGVSGDDPTMLSAFVLAALLEAGEDPTSEVVSNGFFCLMKNASNSDPYGMALKANALSLAKHPDTEAAIEKLLSVAVNDSDVVYWEMASKTESSHGTDAQVSPLAVETAGYVVLAMMQSDPDRHMQVARSIIKWISQQRNGQGGFISTQDTVIALQALALFESFQHEGPLNLQVTATGPDFTTSFAIDESNKLLNQRFDVPTIPSEVALQFTGTGCALMQGVVRYNVPDPKPSEAFTVSVAAIKVPDSKKRTNLEVCTSYLLRDGKSNMVVVEVTLVSGYIPEKEHLKKIVGFGSGDVKRYEIDGNKLQFYIDELTPSNVCMNFDVIKEVDVADAKPGNVKVYDYYEPELVVTENYELM